LNCTKNAFDGRTRWGAIALPRLPSRYKGGKERVGIREGRNGREGKDEGVGREERVGKGVGLPPVPDLSHAVPRPGKTCPGTPNVPDFKVKSK